MGAGVGDGRRRYRWRCRWVGRRRGRRGGRALGLVLRSGAVGDAVGLLGHFDRERIADGFGFLARRVAVELLTGRAHEAERVAAAVRGRRGAGARRRAGVGLRGHRDRSFPQLRDLLAREALHLRAGVIDEAGLCHLGHDGQLREGIRRGSLGLGTPVVLVIGADQAVAGLRAWLDRALPESRDLHLDRRPRHDDVGFTHTERVHPVRDVRAGLFHHLVGGAFGCREGHRDTSLEVEPEDRLQRAAREPDHGRERQCQHEDDGGPQASRALHASSAPFTMRRNRASRCSAATRQSCIRPRKISKYSMTWLMPVSIVSSRLTVRAAESTRRNDCSTA